MDSVLHSIAQRIEHVAMCTKSIKRHRLLLLDSGLCTAKSWMLCICQCTNSIKVQQLGYLFTGFLLLMDFGGFGMVSSQNALGVRVKERLTSFFLDVCLLTSSLKMSGRYLAELSPAHSSCFEYR